MQEVPARLREARHARARAPGALRLGPARARPRRALLARGPAGAPRSRTSTWSPAAGALPRRVVPLRGPAGPA